MRSFAYSEFPFWNVLDVEARDVAAAGARRVHRHHVEALCTFDHEKPFEAVNQPEFERWNVAAVDPGGRVRFEFLIDELADRAAGDRELLPQLHRPSLRVVDVDGGLVDARQERRRGLRRAG